MASHSQLARQHLRGLLQEDEGGLDSLEKRLQPNLENLPESFPAGTRTATVSLQKRWDYLGAPPTDRDIVLDPQTAAEAQNGVYLRNIENFIGTLKMPVGIAGPLRVNGLFAKGDYCVPLATTEAALVASYHRGARVISAAGGCTAMMLSAAVNRAPAFAFRNLAEAGRFVAWVLGQELVFHEIVSTCTSHGQLINLGTMVEANHVYLQFSYDTADASGQNMVTFCTAAIVADILERCPVKPQRSYVEGNFSGDKKASAQAYVSVRGKKVTAEATIPAEIVERMLHCTPAQMADYWRMSAMGGVLSGTMGVQGHFANGLTALYIACGQDAACVAESAIGVTRFELTEDGGLYTAVTLPSVMVGTVGGGTNLPSQRACRDLLHLPERHPAAALAEVCAGLLLAGEISIIGAMAAGHFSRAHAKRARGTK